MRGNSTSIGYVARLFLFGFFAVGAFAFGLPDRGFAKTYYVSPSGDDTASGTSPSLPIRTLEKVRGLEFEPGDSVLLEGGGEFIGPLYFDPSNTRPPLELGSYGTGKARISVPEGDGITFRNLGNVTIRGLKVVGSGHANNRDNGIEIVSDGKGGGTHSEIRVDDVEITGFGMSGLRLNSTGEKSGFRDVRFTRVEAYENGFAGIETTSKYPDIPHENVYIAYSKAHHNHGISGFDSHSGSGIVMGGARGGLIEHSEAYENGALCDSWETGGPAGIWVWNSDRVIIQFNKSFRNRTGNNADGGGYDIDGGTTNSVLQYNYSADNDGYGYQLAEFGSDKTFSNNVVRHNISVGDGNGTSVGAFHVWGRVEDSSFENNIAYSRTGSRKESYSVSFQRWVGMNLSFRNNFFCADAGSSPIWKSESTGQTLEMEGNTYASRGLFQPVRLDDRSISTWDEWRLLTGLEKSGILVQGARLPDDVFNFESKELLSESDFQNAAMIIREIITSGSLPSPG